MYVYNGPRRTMINFSVEEAKQILYKAAQFIATSTTYADKQYVAAQIGKFCKPQAKEKINSKFYWQGINSDTFNRLDGYLNLGFANTIGFDHGGHFDRAAYWSQAKQHAAVQPPVVAKVGNPAAINGRTLRTAATASLKDHATAIGIGFAKATNDRLAAEVIDAKAVPAKPRLTHDVVDAALVLMKEMSADSADLIRELLRIEFA